MKQIPLFVLALGLGLAACGDAPAPKTDAPKPETPAASAPKTDANAPGTVAPTPAAPTPAAPTAEAPKTDAPKPAVSVGTEPGQKLPAFTAALQTKSGAELKSSTFDSSKLSGVTVYAISSTTCPYTKKYAEKMVAIEKEYAAKGVTFVYLYPDKRETKEARLAFHAERGFQAPLVQDDGGTVTKVLAGTKTPEYVVTDASGVIVYRGAVDDSGGAWQNAKIDYLKQGIDAALKGTTPSVTVTSPAG